MYKIKKLFLLLIILILLSSCTSNLNNNTSNENIDNLPIMTDIRYYPIEDNKERVLVEFGSNVDSYVNIPSSGSGLLDNKGEVTDSLIHNFYLKYFDIKEINKIILSEDKEYSFMIIDNATFISNKEYLKYDINTGAIYNVYAFKTTIHDIEYILLLIFGDNANYNYLGDGHIFNETTNEKGVCRDFIKK